MYEFLSIVLIIFGVLQIILFFKMWMMTNDVRKIKEKLKCGNDRQWEIRKAILRGDDNLAKELLMDCLMSDIEKYSEFSGIDEICKRYDASFKQLGMEIPERLKPLKSYSDIREIFTF